SLTEHSQKNRETKNCHLAQHRSPGHIHCLFLLHDLDLIPANLIGAKIHLEAGTVSTVNGCTLRFISIVDHTELAVFDVSMNFHIEILTEPPAQIFFVMGSPQNCPIKDSAV